MVFIKISKISKFIFDAQFGHSVGSALAENIGNPIKTGWLHTDKFSNLIVILQMFKYLRR